MSLKSFFYVFTMMRSIMGPARQWHQEMRMHFFIVFTMMRSIVGPARQWHQEMRMHFFIVQVALMIINNLTEM